MAQTEPYIVFQSTENERGELYWLNRPVGVFYAPNGIEACKAAAKKAGSTTNFFAVPGVPWGMAFMQVHEDVQEFGGGTREERNLLNAIKRVSARQLGAGS